MISPIVKLNNIEVDDEYVDDTLVSNINKSKETVYEYQIANYLREYGFDEVEVSVEGNVSNNVFEIENVYVDITNLVLTKNNENINIYEVIINEISNEFRIDSKRIFVYG